MLLLLFLLLIAFSVVVVVVVVVVVLWCFRWRWCASSQCCLVVARVCWCGWRLERRPGLFLARVASLVVTLLWLLVFGPAPLLCPVRVSRSGFSVVVSCWLLASCPVLGVYSARLCLVLSHYFLSLRTPIFNMDDQMNECIPSL